jgi:hypothetical protein
MEKRIPPERGRGSHPAGVFPFYHLGWQCQEEKSGGKKFTAFFGKNPARERVYPIVAIKLLTIFPSPLCRQTGKELNEFSKSQPAVPFRHARESGHPVLSDPPGFPLSRA